MQNSHDGFQQGVITKGKALRRNHSTAGRSRQQDRAISTRRDLMNAARRIFARDGFEMARLEDIAAAAGKTRGAFYANFRDKEDVFFALFEETLFREKQHMGEQLRAAGSDDERIEVMTKHLRSVLGDRRRMLLALEFKLYAIRHPKRTKRLAELHAALCRRCIEANVEKVIPEYASLTAQQRRRKTAQVGALVDGIALNRMFDGHGLTEDLIERHLRAALRIALAED
jgi:AcrR family transcriptional regulator